MKNLSGFNFLLFRAIRNRPVRVVIWGIWRFSWARNHKGKRRHTVWCSLYRIYIKEDTTQTGPAGALWPHGRLIQWQLVKIYNTTI